MSIFYGYDIDTLLLYGGTMVKDIAMGDNSIFNVKDLTFSNTLDSIDLNNKQLKKLAAPTDPQDAMSKGYTEANFLQLSGGTMAGNIAMDNNIISNIKNLTFSDTFDGVNLNDKQLKQLGNPTDSQDAVSKNYTDTNFLQLSGGTMAGPLTLHPSSTGVQDAVSKNYTDTNFLQLSGGTMAGNIVMGNKQLKQLSDPTDPQDAASKGYTEANFLQLSGGAMAGNIAMGNKQLKQLSAPTDPQDAMSKGYTEANFLRLSGGTMTGPLALHPSSTGAQNAVSKNYTDTNFLQLSGGTMAGPLTLRSHPTENFHPCTKQFTEELVRRGRKVELVYGEWNYKAIGRTRLRYSGESIMIGNTLSESSNAALNIITISFYTSSTSYKGQSIKLLLSLRYDARDGARGTADLGTVVLDTWRHNSHGYGGLLTSQVNKEFNLHKTLTKVVTTSIRSFDIGIRHGQGGSELPSGECLLLVSLSDMV